MSAVAKDHDHDWGDRDNDRGDRGHVSGVPGPADRVSMLGALSTYSLKLGEQSGDVIGFLYYSGHGISRPGTSFNFLIPIDIKDLSQSDVWFDVISLDSPTARIVYSGSERYPFRGV